MKISHRLSIILIVMCASRVAFAGFYSKDCLDICFRTGHDCNYCNYHCYKEPRVYPIPNYSGNTVCPLNYRYQYRY
jgi:hypothetical protein